LKKKARKEVNAPRSASRRQNSKTPGERRRRTKHTLREKTWRELKRGK